MLQLKQKKIKYNTLFTYSLFSIIKCAGWASLQTVKKPHPKHLLDKMKCVFVQGQLHYFSNWKSLIVKKLSTSRNTCLMYCIIYLSSVSMPNSPKSVKAEVELLSNLVLNLKKAYCINIQVLWHSTGYWAFMTQVNLKHRLTEDSIFETS